MSTSEAAGRGRVREKEPGNRATFRKAPCNLRKNSLMTYAERLTAFMTLMRGVRVTESQTADKNRPQHFKNGTSDAQHRNNVDQYSIICYITKLVAWLA